MPRGSGTDPNLGVGGMIAVTTGSGVKFIVNVEFAHGLGQGQDVDVVHPVGQSGKPSSSPGWQNGVVEISGQISDGNDVGLSNLFSDGSGTISFDHAYGASTTGTYRIRNITIRKSRGMDRATVRLEAIRNDATIDATGLVWEGTSVTEGGRHEANSASMGLSKTLLSATDSLSMLTSATQDFLTNYPTVSATGYSGTVTSPEKWVLAGVQAVPTGPNSVRTVGKFDRVPENVMYATASAIALKEGFIDELKYVGDSYDASTLQSTLSAARLAASQTFPGDSELPLLQTRFMGAVDGARGVVRHIYRDRGSSPGGPFLSRYGRFTGTVRFPYKCFIDWDSRLTKDSGVAGAQYQWADSGAIANTTEAVHRAVLVYARCQRIEWYAGQYDPRSFDGSLNSTNNATWNGLAADTVLFFDIESKHPSTYPKPNIKFVLLYNPVGWTRYSADLTTGLLGASKIKLGDLTEYDMFPSIDFDALWDINTRPLF